MRTMLPTPSAAEPTADHLLSTGINQGIRDHNSTTSDARDGACRALIASYDGRLLRAVEVSSSPGACRNANLNVVAAKEV